MSFPLKPIRRVVTGNDAQGRSRVLYDGPAPNVNPPSTNPPRFSGMTDVWVFKECPAPITGDRDDGALPYKFEPPRAGGHLRIVESMKKPDAYDRDKDPIYVAPHEPRLRKDGVLVRGGQSYYTTAMHKSETVDYGICLSGERVLVLDKQTLVMRPGDIVVQLGNWHMWSGERDHTVMAFVMMGAKYEG
jgi:hypothetical protein